MRLDDNLEIRAVVANRVDIPGGYMHGDIYDSLERMRSDYPNAQPVFGAIIVDRSTGLVAEGFEDWYADIWAAYGAWTSSKPKAFKLTIEYDGKQELTVKYHDGSDNEHYGAKTRSQVINIVKDVVKTAFSPEDD